MEEKNLSDSDCCKCHVCGRSFKVLKRCKSCKAAFYCSRQCQIEDWPTHRLKCSTKKTSDGKTGIIKMISSNDGMRNDHSAQRQNGNENSKGIKQRAVLQVTQASDISLVNTLSNELEQCTVKSPSSSDSYENPVSITVKTSKQRHRLTLDKHEGSCGENLLQDIANRVHIPLSKLKLIHKGKIVTADNIDGVLSDRAVFQAIGEVAESEEGLRTKDVECVMDRMKVDRNTAIKALRQTGDVIDAILYLGNL